MQWTSINTFMYLRCTCCHLPESFFGRNGSFLYQYDNTPCHRARLVVKCLDDMGAEVLDWPAKSPDMNPIEHLWEMLFKSVQGTKPGNKDHLWANLQQAWNEFSSDAIKKLVELIPSGMASVIKARGSHMKYWLLWHFLFYWTLFMIKKISLMNCLSLC